jgi:hypothetical protein
MKELTNWQPMPNQEIVEKNFGFVYRLTLPDGRWYIGKKNFWANKKTKRACRTKGKIVEKGKKKTVRVHSESDWKTYFSSGYEIARYVEEHGKDGIVAEILEVTPKTGKEGTAGAGHLAYRELFWQLQSGWGTDPKCLNGIIHVRLSPQAACVNTEGTQHQEG